MLERRAPPLRGNKGQKPFYDKHDSQCLPDTFTAHRTCASYPVYLIDAAAMQLPG